MNVSNSRWIGGVVTGLALITGIALFGAVGISVSQSLATVLLFAGSLFGFQRIYAGILDVLFITLRRD